QVVLLQRLMEIREVRVEVLPLLLERTNQGFDGRVGVRLFRSLHGISIILLIGLLTLAGCGRTSASPTQQPASGSAAPGSTWTVTGTVWVAGSFGVEVATRGEAFAWVESGAPGDAGRATDVTPISVEGRYELTIPAGTKRLRLQGPLFQPCAVTLEPTADAVADIQVVRDESMLGARLPAALNRQEPMLSGVAYELSSGSRQPLEHVSVLLDTNYGGNHVIARTVTDAD